MIENLALNQINNMEHMIQHETLPLKEEKHLIRQINQLKHLRDQLSSNMGSQDEVQQALDQREQNEEKLKVCVLPPPFGWSFNANCFAIYCCLHVYHV